MNRDTLKVTRVAFVLQYKGRCQQTGLHKIYVEKKTLGNFRCVLYFDLIRVDFKRIDTDNEDDTITTANNVDAFVSNKNTKTVIYGHQW